MSSTYQNTAVACLDQVSKVYGSPERREAALKNVSFKAYHGEMVLLLGPSGSGKTTFLTLLAGMQSPSRGKVELFGRELGAYSQKEIQQLRANRIGFVFQSFHLIDSLTVFENILLVLMFAGIKGREANRRAIEYLQQFEVSHLTKAYPNSLSQGEKQRVAVARALVNGASFIIADEPTGSLATQQGMMIVDMLRRNVDERDICVVIASHDERIVEKSNRVLYLNDGVLGYS